MGRRANSEGDTIPLTNPGPEKTVAGQPAIVAGFAGWWNEGGIEAGRKCGFVARQVGDFEMSAPAGTALAEGDTVVLSDNGNLYRKGNSTGTVKDYGKALDGLAAGKSGWVRIRLISQ